MRRRSKRDRWHGLQVKRGARAVMRHLFASRGTGCSCRWCVLVPDVVAQIAQALP